MTLTRIDFDIVQRSRGNCAVKIMAYDMCGKMQKHDGTAYDFGRKKSELVHAEIMLPDGAPVELYDPQALANACELSEKQSDSQTGRLLLFTCPRECPEHLRIELARIIAQPYVEQGMGVAWAYHSPRAADGSENPHIHFFLTTRAVAPGGLAPKKSPEWDRQFRAKLPPSPEDPKPKNGSAERQRICDRANTFFAKHDLQIRLDPRRLEQQGIDRPPEPDAPRNSWQAWKRTGAVPAEAPAPVARVLRHRKLRKELAEISIEQAKISAAIERYERAISLAEARTKTEIAKPKMEEIMSASNTNQWMFQDRGLIGLSSGDRAEAEQAYEAFTQRYPDATGRRTLAGYVDAIQAPMRQMSMDENPYDAEGNLVDSADDRPQVVRHQIFSYAGPRTDGLAHAEALAAGQYLHSAVIKPHAYKYVIADGGHTAIIQLSQGRIIDEGSRLTAEGKLSPEISNLMHQLALARGWEDYETTEDPEFKVAMTRAQEQPKVAKKPANEKSANKPSQPSKKAMHPAEPWMEKQGGYDALSDTLRASAKESYKSWLDDAANDAQRAKRKEFGLHDYCDYVQRKFAERRAEQEKAEAAKAAATDAKAPSDAKKSVRAARETEESKREFSSFVHRLLSERYEVPEGLHDFVKRLDINKDSGEATLTLKSGGKLIDTGTEIRTTDADVNEALADATVATAYARGWASLTVTGSEDYRTAIAKAAALHQPPISTDIELSQAIREEISAALVARARAALRESGNSVAPSTNSVSPTGHTVTASQTQAAAMLDRAQAIQQAELAGEPKAPGDLAAITGPRISELDKQLESARQAAQEASSAADAHAKEFPRMRRLLDAGARTRHAALEIEAARLAKVADKLDSGYKKAVDRIKAEALKEARAATRAHDDWRYQQPVRRAQTNVADIQRMRAAVAAGDQAILADINAGKLNDATAKLANFEASQIQKARNARTPQQVRGQAIDAAMAEIAKSERKPERKAAAEEAMRAAVNGDPATIAALDAGKVDDALKAAAAWRRKLDEEAAKIKKAKEQQEALERRNAPPSVTVAQP